MTNYPGKRSSRWVFQSIPAMGKRKNNDIAPRRNKPRWTLLQPNMDTACPTPITAIEPLVSVIIPALDEAAWLGRALAAVQSAEVAYEIIVVDAGSSDDTTQIAASAGVRVLQSVRRQRAHQLNLGAQHARGAVLLFLHADTVLPPRALDSIMAALSDPRTVGGAFTRRYASSSALLRATCFLARCRNQLIGWHLGDQAMFVRRSSFFQLGGFLEVSRFEDLDFSRRLRRFGRTVTLQPWVTSSPRRFERCGPARTTTHDFLLTMRYLTAGLPETDPVLSSHVRPSYAQAKRVGNL